jgi:hypothetical protein
MIATSLALMFLLGPPQQSDKLSDPASPQSLEQGSARYEAHRQAAIHINELAGNIHSDAAARAFVDAVAEQLTEHRDLSWTTFSIRHRVAQAEYEAVSDPSRLIPEQRVVDVWNEYVREIDATEETLVTVAELYNLRDAMYTSSRLLWKKDRFPQSLWIIPNLYAVDSEGKVASGCRAVEALKILHDMSYLFQNVRSARERVQKGVLASDLARQRRTAPTPRPQGVVSHLAISTDTNPVRMAEYRYLQAHSQLDYRRLLERLFAALFPAE